VRLIGDALSPGTIAAAVWDGRRYAEELDAAPGDDALPPFRREVVALAEMGPGPARRGEAPIAGR
jgi:dimethylamine/trimethylamine dehydrogenase